MCAVQLNCEPVNIDVAGQTHLQLNYAVECDAMRVGLIRMGGWCCDGLGECGRVCV